MINNIGMKYIVLISFCLLLQNNFADVYQSVDKQGHVVFSDKASDNATKITVNQPSVLLIVTPAVATPMLSPVSAALPAKDMQVTIMAPQDHAEILYNGEPIKVLGRVSANLSPNEQALLLIDGVRYQTLMGPRDGTELPFSMNALSNGPHRLQIQIQRETTIIASSDPIEIVYHHFRPGVINK